MVCGKQTGLQRFACGKSVFFPHSAFLVRKGYFELPRAFAHELSRLAPFQLGHLGLKLIGKEDY